MRIPALEAVGHEKVLSSTGKGFDQKAVARRQARAPELQTQPFLHGGGKVLPGVTVIQQPANPLRQVRRQRQPPAHVGRNLGIAAAAPSDLRRHVPEPFEAEQLAGEDEAVAGAQTLDEVLLHLPQYPLRTLEAHLHHRCRHDDAEIEAVAADVCRPGHPPAPLVILLQAPEPLVAAQRIAAAGDKLENGIEVRAPQVRIGRGGGHLLVKLLRAEGCGASDAEDMLRENVEPAGAHLFSIEAVGTDGLDGRLALQYLEAVARHQQGPARSIEAVIGSAEALQQAGGSLGRSYLYNQTHDRKRTRL